MRGLHLADLHLDRPFEGMPFLTEEASARLAHVVDDFLAQLVRRIQNAKLDVLFVCGDTFHYANPNPEIVQKWCDTLAQIQECDVEIYIIFGNHDPYNTIQQQAPYPSGVHLWKDEEVQTIYGETRQHEYYAVTGFSYTASHLLEDKAIAFPRRDEQVNYHFGLYHGQEGGEYAPFQKQELEACDYDYIAMGHYHQPTVLTSHIQYAGTAQPKIFREAMAGQGILFELTQQGLHLESFPTAVYELETWKFPYVENHIELQEAINEKATEKPVIVEVQAPIELVDISGIDTNVIVAKSTIIEDVSPCYIDGVSSGLINEMKRHYAEENLFVALQEELVTQRSLQPYLKQLVENRVDIVEEAMIEWQQDLRGEQGET